jgi:hypothetical protein
VIYPTFAGRFFSGDEAISIPPKSTYDYTVTYHPTEMTRACKDRHNVSILIFKKVPYQVGGENIGFKQILHMLLHSISQASVYFLMSSGAVTLYNFVGLASAPETAGKISNVVKSRAAWTQPLLIQNWLDQPQTFSVKNEILSLSCAGNGPGGKPISKSELHEFVFLVGHEKIEVEALASKEYMLHFIAYREGVYSYRVRYSVLHLFLSAILMSVLNSFA